MRVVPMKTWEFVHVCTLSAYTLVISRNISVHDYEYLSVLINTAARALTGSSVKLCSEKTLDMPFLAYFGCSKLLKAGAVFYWGTHTRFTVSVGIDHSLTKTRRTRCADCICRARIGPLWELYIPRMREQWCPGRFFPPPQKNGLGTRRIHADPSGCAHAQNTVITVGWVAPLVYVDDDCISSGVALTARRIHMAWARYSVVYSGSCSVMVGWVAPLVCVSDGHVSSH